jgi:hypothetical protein
VNKWGGEVSDYLPLHSWFDQSKAIAGDFRHRALRHHAEGIFMLVIWTGKPVLMFASPGRVVPYLFRFEYVNHSYDRELGIASQFGFPLWWKAYLWRSDPRSTQLRVSGHTPTAPIALDFGARLYADLTDRFTSTCRWQRSRWRSL